MQLEVGGNEQAMFKILKKTHIGYSMWKGVRVVVIKRNGQPQTIAPTLEQPKK